MKRIIECYIKYRKWFFFLACVLTLVTLLYLHGSVYRYVVYINGVRKLPQDERTFSVYHIYIWLSLITLFLQILAGIPYFFVKKPDSKIENNIIISFISILIILIVTSMVVLGVFYV